MYVIRCACSIPHVGQCCTKQSILWRLTSLSHIFPKYYNGCHLMPEGFSNCCFLHMWFHAILNLCSHCSSIQRCTPNRWKLCKVSCKYHIQSSKWQVSHPSCLCQLCTDFVRIMACNHRDFIYEYVIHSFKSSLHLSYCSSTLSTVVHIYPQ